MRRPPPLTDFPKYPVVVGTILLAAAVSLAYWSGKVDISPLFETVDIRRGQLWRLLTSALPHANVLHLLFNLYWTWVFGTLLEQRFGHLKTLALFLLLSLAANGAEYAFLDGGIGLSGIGYGLFGLLWILSRKNPKFAGVIDQQTISTFVIWFFICIALTYAGTPIANLAHGIGCLTGALLGFILSVPPKQRLLPIAALTLMTIAILFACTIARPYVNLSKTGAQGEGDLAYQLLTHQQYAQALPWLLDAVRMNPHEPIFWYNLGIAYENLNRRPEALAAYRRAATLEPSNPDYQSAAKNAPDTQP